MRDKFKGIIEDDQLYYSLILVLAVGIAFMLGRYSVGPNLVASRVTNTESSAGSSLTGTAILKTSNQPNKNQPTTTINTTQIQDFQYVASKNSNKYHLPWCSGAKRISETNKIYFTSKSEAEKAGYLPASNCPGI